ncbi:MAG TPA: STAS domain-containing protein [Pilimelia sp.]|nr:STAS domain-containing protein [Pilimelia sp.]
MTLVPGADADTLSLVCDSCGQTVTDIEATAGQWPVVWAVVARAGWAGSPLAIGPHHCAQCWAAPPPTTAEPAAPAGAPPGRTWDGAALVEHPVACVLGLRGQLDLLSVGELRGALDEALHRHRNVVLDLSGVRLLDAAGLAQLTRARAAARGRGGELCLVCPSDLIRTTLRTLRMGHLFPVFADGAQALHWLADRRPTDRDQPTPGADRPGEGDHRGTAGDPR